MPDRKIEIAIPVNRKPYASAVLSFFDAATKRVMAFWIPAANMECASTMTGETRPMMPRPSSLNILERKIR